MFSEISPSNGLDLFFKGSSRNFHSNASKILLNFFGAHLKIFKKKSSGISLLTPQENIKKKMSLNNSQWFKNA